MAHKRNWKRSHSHSHTWNREHSALKWVALSLSVLLLAMGDTGAYVYVHFDRNFKSAPLLPKGTTQATEVPDIGGLRPMNILLLGNAGRLDAADCQLGGACTDTAPTADTMMVVVHLAADRSNMTVMSIPRDSIVNLPACAHDPVDLINVSLTHGPSCSVEAVHDLTGLTIDHFIEIDMAGIVTMSNALGGVPVCVTNNASLTHVTTLYSVVDAATKALTVDEGLGSAMDLLNLAQEIGKVPTQRVTMLSVPTEDYSGPNAAWRLSRLQFQQPEADQMFAAIKADVPYTPSASSPPDDSVMTNSADANACVYVPHPEW